MNNLENFRYQNVLNKCLEICHEIETELNQENTFDVDKLKELEKKITKIASKEFDKLSFDKFRKAFRTLSNIKLHVDALHTLYVQSQKENSAFNRYNDSNVQRINGLSVDLLKISKKLEMSGIEKEKIPQREKVDMTFGIFSDFNVPDENGAIAGDLVQCLKNKMPCIATQSIVSGAQLGHSGLRFEHFNKIVPLLNECEIFELMADHEEPTGLFVLLPLKTDDEEENTPLEKYDLNQNGLLKKASSSRVLEFSNEKPTINDLRKIFSADPKKNKIFYLAGHGGKDEAIGGISKKEFPKMMEFFEGVACKGLLIESCYAGGANTEAFTKLPRPASYPIVLSSTGDFPTFGHDSTLETRLTALKEMIENPFVAPTAKDLRKKYEFLQKQQEKSDYDLQSLMQIHIPGFKDISTDFRAIGEGCHLFPLTNMSLKQAMITHDSIKSEGEIIGFYPKIVTVPVEAPSTSTLHSMHSGDSLHVLKELGKIEKISDLINKTLEFSKNGSGRKAFCIGEMNDKSGNSIQEVVILCSSALPVCAFQKGGKYYLTKDGQTETEISPLKHAMLCREAMNLEKKAMDPTSDSSSFFITYTEPDLFYQKESPSKQAVASWGPLLNTFTDKKKETDFTQASNFFNNEQINQEDKDHFLCKLLLAKPELALELLEKIKNLTLHASDYSGRGLSSYAVSTGNLQLVEKLVNMGLNFFEKDQKNFSGIDVAFSQGYWKIAKRLLAEEPYPNLFPVLSWISAITKFIDIPHSDPDYADAKEIVYTVLSKGTADVPICSRSDNPEIKTSFLGMFASQGNGEAVRILLEAGYNPNKLNCLCEAINGGNEAVIDEMLKKGGNLLLKDSQGNIPLIEAVAKTSPQIFSKLIQSLKNSSKAGEEIDKAVDSEPEAVLGKTLSNLLDDNDITPLIAASMSRDHVKIGLLLKEGVRLNDNSSALRKFSSVVETFIATDDRKSIEMLLELLVHEDILSRLSYDGVSYLLDNGYFESSLKSLEASSPLFALLIGMIIRREGVDHLNELREKIPKINLNLLNNDEKLYLIKKGLIDAEKMGIDLEELEAATEVEGDSGSSDSESDTDSESELTSDSETEKN